MTSSFFVAIGFGTGTDKSRGFGLGIALGRSWALGIGATMDFDALG